MRLVSQRTSLLLSVKSLHTRVTGQDLDARLKALAPEEAGGLFDDPSDRLIAGVQVQLLQHFQTSIDKVEKAALKNVSDLPSYQGLQSLPGWQDFRADHSVGNGGAAAFCQRGKLRQLLPVCGFTAHFQWEEEGGKQSEVRQ